MGQTLKEIQAIRRKMEEEYRNMPKIPCVPFGNFFNLDLTHRETHAKMYVPAGAEAVQSGVIAFVAIDAFCREWIRLRPECLQEQEAKP